jgi:hypothetical protein
VARAFEAYELGAPTKFTQEQFFSSIKKEYQQRPYKLMMLLRAILTLCAMNIGKMTLKHGHILIMECYILRVKAVDVEYIGKYKDERTYTQLLILDEWIC